MKISSLLMPCRYGKPRLYWTFVHESLNGVLKRIANRNSNHKSVGWSIFKMLFMKRMLTQLLCPVEQIPQPNGIFRRGIVLEDLSAAAKALLDTTASPVLYRDMAIRQNFQKIRAGCVVCFLDKSHGRVVDVIGGLDVGNQILFAKLLTASDAVDAITGSVIYSVGQRVYALHISAVLYTVAVSTADDGSIIFITANK
jgi:hypothetical protein